MNRLGVRLALVLAMFAGLSVAPSVPPAGANAPGAAICVVDGVVNVTPGAGALPPGAAGPGTYAFASLTIACAGMGTDAVLPILPAPPGIANQLIGIAPAASAGATGTTCGPATPGIGQFCGTYTAGPFLTGASCAGGIGGPGLPAGEPVPPSVDTTPDAWSLIFGNVLLGHIDCDTGPAMTATSTGVIALTAVPITADGITGPLPAPGCAGPAPIGAPFPPPAEWFCSLLVTGVAVLVDTTVV
jgi:hypothetical protein